MSVEGSESRRFELTFGWVFLRPILAQDRPRNYFFRGFWKVWNFFFEDLCSGREIFWPVSLKFYLFMETSPFHCDLSYAEFVPERRSRGYQNFVLRAFCANRLTTTHWRTWKRVVEIRNGGGKRFSYLRKCITSIAVLEGMWLVLTEFRR